MQLHTLQSSIGRKKKRVGRGGKRGTYSGRGTKGQRARAGRKIRPAERDVLLRLPKRRGMGNPMKTEKDFVVSLTLLDRLAGKSGKSAITPDVLRREGLVPRRHHGGIKVLNKGEIGNPVTLRGVSVSEGARQKIEKAGGKVS